MRRDPEHNAPRDAHRAHRLGRWYWVVLACALIATLALSAWQPLGFAPGY